MVIAVRPANSGSIYAVSTHGKVFQLAYNEWIELSNSSNPDLRLKRICCCLNAIFSICGDHQIYLRLESEVPVRVQEISYENQRWNPASGFCDKLLPTDR